MIEIPAADGWSVGGRESRMKRQWKVGEIAKLTGLTIRTLRYYDQIGLFSPTGQTESGHRLYDEGDIERLHQVLALKELGLTLEEIKSVLTRGTSDPSEIISAQIARLKDNIRIQQKLLGELEQASALMRMKETLTVDDLTRLLRMMKKSHEKYFWERQATVENTLDQLGRFLADMPDEP